MGRGRPPLIQHLKEESIKRRIAISSWNRTSLYRVRGQGLERLGLSGKRRIVTNFMLKLWKSPWFPFQFGFISRQSSLKKTWFVEKWKDMWKTFAGKLEACVEDLLKKLLHHSNAIKWAWAYWSIFVSWNQNENINFQTVKKKLWIGR